MRVEAVTAAPLFKSDDDLMVMPASSANDRYPSGSATPFMRFQPSFESFVRECFAAGMPVQLDQVRDAQGDIAFRATAVRRLPAGPYEQSTDFTIVANQLSPVIRQAGA